MTKLDLARAAGVRHGQLLAGIGGAIQNLELAARSGSLVLLDPADRELLTTSIDQLRAIEGRAWSKA